MSAVELFEAWVRLASALADGRVLPEEFDERLVELHLLGSQR